MKETRYLVRRLLDGTILYWNSNHGYGGGCGQWTPKESQATVYKTERGATIAFSAVKRIQHGSFYVGIKTDDGLEILESPWFKAKYQAKAEGEGL